MTGTEPQEAASRAAGPRSDRGVAPAPARARRWDLVLAGCLVAGPALALLVWLAARQQVGNLEERLVRDANAVFTATFPRPVHADAVLPGSAGVAVAAHLARFEAVAEADDAADVERKAVRAFVAGEAAALPARYAAQLEALGSALDALLASSRSERAALDAGRDPFAEAEGKPWKGYQLAALLAGVRVRLALREGDRAAALADCLDGLGVARDAALAGGLVGHMVGAVGAARLTAPCAAVLERSTAAELADAVTRLRVVRDAFPPFSATLREEAIAVQLAGGALLVDAGIRARLPARARAGTGAVEGADAAHAWYERLLLRDAWRVSRAALDALVAAADLPDAEREAAFGAVKADLARRLNFVVAALPVDSYLKFARRAENLRRRLDALAVAAAARRYRLEHGAWPGSLDDLRAAGLLSSEEVSRGAVSLEAGAAAGGMAVVAALLAAGEVDPARITLALSRPAAGAAAARPVRRAAAAAP